jgi:hypothetical protein
MSERQRLSRIRAWLWLFVAGLLLAGVTAFPLEWESRVLSQWLHGSGSWAGDAFPAMRGWIDQVRYGLAVSYDRYPWLAYGTDWLAFGHITIAMAFAGPIRDPVRHRQPITAPWFARSWRLGCAVSGKEPLVRTSICRTGNPMSENDRKTDGQIRSERLYGVRFPA